MSLRASPGFLLILSIGAFVFLRAALLAQITTDTNVPIFKVSARTVVLDVVATDKSGQPVQGLKREVFEVNEDGHPQRITSFEEHTGAQLTSTPMPALPTNVFTNIPPFKQSDSVTVLILDSLNTELQDQNYVRKQMIKYLKNPLPGQRVAVFTLGNKLRMVQGFTDDPAVLAGVLNSKKSGATAQTSWLLQTHGEMTSDAEIAATQTISRVSMTLQALQQLANYLAGYPGRKNVIWFSSAFPSIVMTPSGPENLGEDIKKTDALVASARMSIYPVAAEGVAVDSSFNAEQRSGPAANGQTDSTQRIASHTTMDEIARDTGGDATYNGNGLSEAVARVASSGSYYYTLSYTPTNAANDGQFRKIEVKLAAGKYRLAFRHGYYAADAKGVQMPVSNASSDPLRPYMGAGTPDSTGIPFALRVQRAQTRNSKPAGPGTQAGDNPKLQGPTDRYSVDFVIAATGLQLDAAEKGGRKGKIQATLVVYDRSGQALNWLVREINLDMDAARYVQVRENGVNFRLNVDAPISAASLRCGVYDYGSNLVGTHEVPVANVVSPNPAQNIKSP